MNFVEKLLMLLGVMSVDMQMQSEMTPHDYLLSKGWLYMEAVYPYRDPWHKLSTYTLQDALEIQRERDSIDWGIFFYQKEKPGRAWQIRNN